ncbi:hypothetical protein [Prosthecobacter sp.]|jgi:hypothetical protein|uniref:hypothetical protein n=1 Tax=Prosthecobacter sp. TaxID=1965333 RepID=UPI003784DA2E
MPEVQSHGFTFEKWVKQQFFGGYEGSYMQKWDVAAEHNNSVRIPECFRNLPVSIKTAKRGSPIGLGDVLRQRQIDQPFVMIVGFWEQTSKTEKRITEVGYARFTADTWESLWGELCVDQLRELDRVVKNLNEHYSTVRQKAKLWKVQAVVRSCKIVINPKIDSKVQRRIQCSLPVDIFWQFASQDKQTNAEVTLWGAAFPNPIISPPRSFK